MAVELVGKTLLNNEWTKTIVNKKEFWSKFALDRGLEINGSYSNLHFEFKIEIALNGSKVTLRGHRNYVDLPNVALIEDKYSEVFSINFKPKFAIDLPIIKSYRKSFVGKLFLKIYSLKEFELSKTLMLGCKGMNDFNTVSKIGFFELDRLERVRSSPNGIKVRYGKMFASANDFKQIDVIIESLKTLHNKA